MDDISGELILAVIGLIQFMLTTAFGFAWRAISVAQKRAEENATNWEKRHDDLRADLTKQICELKTDVEELNNLLDVEREAKTKALHERDEAFQAKTQTETLLSTERETKRALEIQLSAVNKLLESLLERFELKKENLT